MIDLIGMRFGKLIVIEKSDKRASSGEILWKCKCDCGNNIETRGTYLRKGQTKSCGCRRKVGRHYDLTGQKFGSLTVLSLADKSEWKHGYRTYHCICDCGNECTSTTRDLLYNNKTSCGCRSFYKFKREMDKWKS